MRSVTSLNNVHPTFRLANKRPLVIETKEEKEVFEDLFLSLVQEVMSSNEKILKKENWNQLSYRAHTTLSSKDPMQDQHLSEHLIAMHSLDPDKAEGFVGRYLFEIVTRDLQTSLKTIIDRRIINAGQVYFMLLDPELSEDVRVFLMNLLGSMDSLDSKDEKQTFYKCSILLDENISDSIKNKVVSIFSRSSSDMRPFIASRFSQGLVRSNPPSSEIDVTKTFVDELDDGKDNCSMDKAKEIFSSKDPMQDQYLSEHLIAMHSLDPDKAEGFVNRYLFEIVTRNLQTSLKTIIDRRIINAGQIYSMLLVPGLSEDVQALLVDVLNFKDNEQAFYGEVILAQMNLPGPIKQTVIKKLAAFLSSKNPVSEAKDQLSIRLNLLLQLAVKENMWEEVKKLLNHMREQNISVGHLKETMFKAWENDQFEIVTLFCFPSQGDTPVEEVKSHLASFGIAEEVLRIKLGLNSSDPEKVVDFSGQRLILLYIASLFKGLCDQLCKRGVVKNILLSTDDSNVYRAFLDLYLNYLPSKEKDNFIMSECKRISDSKLGKEFDQAVGDYI